MKPWPGFLLAVAMICASCSGDDATESNRETPSVLEQTIAKRIDICLKSGATIANCKCRSETAADHLPLRDFLEETRLLQNGDQLALNEFNRRMLAENRETMFRLGQALADCPVMSLKAE